jgi:LruC domain-containing protein
MIDLYPDDPEKAFESYYPSKTTKASIVFEDLWPFLGDYDFNDTAVDYSIKTISNANNEVVGLDLDYEVTADGASFVNGFAFELPGISPNSVLQISGQVLTNSVFELASNGTELEQTNVVIPLFDDHSVLLGQPGKVSVSFSSPIPEGQLGGGPFKPFLVVDGDRETEIHLVGNTPTSLGNNRPSVVGNNVDADGNYATAEGLPWAINITEEFTVLQEKITIDEGYLFFRAWAISGGKNRKDWYKPNLGYRNPNKLQLD